jgi:hypothetical protein
MSDSTLRLRKTAEAVRQLPDMESKGYAVLKAQPPTQLLHFAEDPEPDEPDPDGDEEALHAPASWHKGQLLNVRNRGEFYVVTLLGEEDEPPLKPAPNGALRFTNTARCQDFVSAWYSREHFDPRAR